MLWLVDEILLIADGDMLRCAVVVGKNMVIV